MPTMQEVKFKRKTTNEIEQLEIEDGSLIYNVENGKTYMDYGTERIPTGGGANGGIYVGDTEPTDPDITLWVDTPTSETKASEIVTEYTESDKVGYCTNYINELVNRQKYTLTSDSTSIDIPVNVLAGEQVKITMIASGDNSNLGHGVPIYFKPNDASNFGYRFIRTSSILPNSSTSAGTPSVLIDNIENSNRIIGFHLDNVYAYGELKCFLTGENRFSFQSESCYASGASNSNCYQQKTNGYINTGTYSTNKIEKITIFTDSSTVKMPAGTTFIVENF